MDKIKTRVQKYLNHLKKPNYANEEIIAYIMKPR